MGEPNICDTEKYETAGISFSCKVTCSNLIAGGDKDSLYNKNCKDLCPSCYKFQVDRASAIITKTLSPYRINPITTPGTTAYVSQTPPTALTPGQIVAICFFAFLIYTILEKLLIVLLYRRTRCFRRAADKLLGRHEPETDRQTSANTAAQPVESSGTPGAGEIAPLIDPSPGPSASNSTETSIPSIPVPSTSRNPQPNPREQTQIKPRWSDNVQPDSAGSVPRGRPDEVQDDASTDPNRKICTDSFLEERVGGQDTRRRPGGNSGPASFPSSQNCSYQSKEEGCQQPKSFGSIAYSDRHLSSQLQSGDETIPKQLAEHGRRHRHQDSPDDKYGGGPSCGYTDVSQAPKSVDDDPVAYTDHHLTNQLQKGKRETETFPEQCTEDAAHKGCTDSFLAERERLRGEGSSQTDIKELFPPEPPYPDMLPEDELQNRFPSLLPISLAS